uniref:C-type lectin domain-containing protein n=1 Tax=Spermophilus dauricus TaxID=99837 RepID=A0A8C9NZA2_SPEDA
MTDSKEVRMQTLGPPGEAGWDSGSWGRGLGGQRGRSLPRHISDVCRGPVRAVAHSRCLIVAICLLGTVSKVPSSQEQEQELAKQEKVYQELTQLKAGVDRLCRPCPWDWTFFQGHCYFFSKSQRNWHDSVTACQEVGAQLVVIKSAEEQSFLQLTTKKRGHTWMGLSDLNKEATWHWVDGSPLSLRFMKYWNPTEPNNLGQEDCAEFDGDGWNDAKCDISKFWVCKKSALSCSHE